MGTSAWRAGCGRAWLELWQAGKQVQGFARHRNRWCADASNAKLIWYVHVGTIKESGGCKRRERAQPQTPVREVSRCSTSPFQCPEQCPETDEWGHIV